MTILLIGGPSPYTRPSGDRNGTNTLYVANGRSGGRQVGRPVCSHSHTRTGWNGLDVAPGECRHPDSRPSADAPGGHRQRPGSDPPRPRADRRRRRLHGRHERGHDELPRRRSRALSVPGECRCRSRPECRARDGLRRVRGFPRFRRRVATLAPEPGPRGPGAIPGSRLGLDRYGGGRRERSRPVRVISDRPPLGLQVLRPR